MVVRFIIGIDPGDKHVGFATWAGNSVDKPGGGIRRAYELDASEALEHVELLLDEWITDGIEPVIVVEEFVLYAWEAQSQSGSNMLTSQMIGAIKWMGERRNVTVVEQKATIKKPTRSQLKARGIKQLGKGTHARDAELHLLYYLLREQEKARNGE